MPALLYICGRAACGSSARKSLSSLFFLLSKPTVISLFAYHCIVCSYPLLAPFACRTHTQIETLTRTAIRRRAICDPKYFSAILLPPNDVEAKWPLLGADLDDRSYWPAVACVGERATNKEVGLGSESPTKDRQVEVGLGSESPAKDRRVLVCCRHANCRTNQTGSTCANQNGGLTCMEPGDLPVSKTNGEEPRCSMGEGVYLPSHF